MSTVLIYLPIIREHNGRCNFKIINVLPIRAMKLYGGLKV
jgi:hypothetical protein